MKLTGYILLPLVLFSLCAGLSAKDRVVEKSGKTPGWLMTSDQYSFSVMAQDTDLSAARQKCLDDIRQYIVNSIASNITSVETSTVDSDIDNGLEDLYTTYSSQLKTAAAKLPFLTGITLSNALEVYWEKCRKKSDGTYYYNYHVLYPFTVKERDKLIKQFKEYDAEKYAALVALREAYPHLADVSMIDAGIRDLEPLVTYFFDDVRKKEAESLLSTYKRAYSLISLVPESQELGYFAYNLMLDGHKITCSKAPQLRSETAYDVELRPEAGGYVITYDYTYCYPSDDNYIQIIYSFPGATLKYRHQIDISQKEKLVFPAGFVEIACVGKDSTMTAEVQMTLRSKTDKSFSAGNVRFDIPSSGLAISSAQMQDFKGKGMKLYRIGLPLDELPEKDERGMVSGTMQVRYDNGRQDEAVFTLPYSVKVYPEKEEPVQEVASDEDTSLDGQSQAETVSEGTVSEGTVSEETVSEETVSEGTVSEETVSEGTVSETDN